MQLCQTSRCRNRARVRAKTKRNHMNHRNHVTYFSCALTAQGTHCLVCRTDSLTTQPLTIMSQAQGTLIIGAGDDAPHVPSAQFCQLRYLILVDTNAFLTCREEEPPYAEGQRREEGRPEGQLGSDACAQGAHYALVPPPQDAPSCAQPAIPS